MIKIVQASVDLEDRENRVVTIVKGKYGLRNKSDAVCFIIRKYEEAFLKEPFKPAIEESSEKQE